jgi:nicotinamide riboside transporter PnuC
MDISQIIIPIVTCASVSALAVKRHRLGFALSLIGQPFWIYTFWKGNLWGMLIVSLWVTGGHALGLWNHRETRAPKKSMGSPHATISLEES